MSEEQTVKYNGVAIDETQQFQKQKSEEGPKKPAAVKSMVTKPVAVKKQGRIERLVKAIIGPDGLPKVGAYLGRNVIGPAIKDTIVKSIQDGVSMMVYGGDIPKGGAPTTRPNYTNYNKPYANQPAQHDRTHGRSSVAYKERGQAQTLFAGAYLNQYLIESSNEAQNILNALMDNTYEYGQATVATYYQLLGIDTVFTDDGFGWDTLSGSRVMPYQGKFIIDLPPVQVLN